MSGYLPKSAITILFTMILTACGGGGGGGGATGSPGGGTTGGGTTGTPTITLTIIDASGNATSNVSGNVPVTVRAVVADGAGSAIVGQVVTFTTAVGAFTPTSGNVLTIAGGVAEISLGAGTTADAGVVSATATINGVAITSNTVGIESDGLGVGTGTVNLTIDFVLNTPDTTVTIGKDNLGTATVTVLDGSGNAVNQALVQFDASIGVLNPADGLVTTGADGKASIQILPGNTAGAGVLSASITSGTETVSANSIPFVSKGDAFTVSFILTTPNNTITVARDNVGTATVTITDANGDAVDQAIVTFTTTNGVLNPASGVVTTNSTGVATVSLLAGTSAGSGVLSASVSIGTVTIQPDANSFVTAGDAFASVTLSIASGLQNTAISNATPQTISATVINADGAAVLGAIVNFSNSGQGVLSVASDITNASGIATTNLLPGTIAGFGTITATTTVDGTALSTPSDGAISFSTAGDGPFDGAGTSNLSIVLALVDGTGTPITGTIDADKPGILQATVLDALAQPLNNIVVEFTTDGIGDLFPISGLSLTNTSGIATVALNAGNVPGAGLATATLLIDGARFNTDQLTFQSLGNAGDTAITLTLSFVDKTPTNGTNIITAADNATVSILVEDASGANLANRTAQITSTLGTQVSIVGGTPASTITAISDFDGRIDVTLEAGTIFGTGDFVVIVGDTTASVQFDVGVAGLQIGTCTGGTSALDCGAGTIFTQGDISIGATPLSAGGTTSIGLVVVDANDAPVTGVDIAFSTNCSTTIDATSNLPQASINATLTSTADGSVTGTYQAATGCVGNDIITAVESSTGQTAIGTLNVLAPNIGAIVYDSVTDPTGTAITNISIKESGGNSTAFVVFQVLDVLGDPAPDQNVQFSLTTNVGSITLQNADATTGIANGLTDANGRATAILEAGFIATTVLVRASLAVDRDDDGDITDFNDVPVGATTLVTLSAELSINTGIADQNSMTLAADTLNFEGGNFDGESITLTVFLADRANNPVPDGTPVAFRTEYGRILPACNTVGGNCTTTLNSQEPRTPLDPNVSQKSIPNSQCPSLLVPEENVTISGGIGATFHQAASILRVETTADVLLTAFSDYSVNSDGSGITCVSGACTGTLKVTYNRTTLDRDISFSASSPTVANVFPATNPGQATTPFRTVSQNLGNPGEVPCRVNATAQGGTLSSGYLGGLGQLYGSRSTVMAFVQGEESFIDTNSNGIYDFNEPFVDLTEAFIDYNEDKVFGNGTVGVDDSRDATFRGCYGPRSPITVPVENQGQCFQVGGQEEEFIDFGTGDTLNGRFDTGNGIYNGTLCPKEVSDRTLTCNNVDDPCVEATDRYCTRELVNINRSLVAILSGSAPRVAIRSTTSGEYVDSVTLSLAAAGGALAVSPGSTGRLNDNTLIAGDFNIGHTDLTAPPQIGDSVSLTARDGGITIDFSDIFNAKLPSGTTIGISTGTGGECTITSTGNTTQATENGTGVSSATINLSLISAAAGGLTTPVTVTITTPRLGQVASFQFNCNSTL